MRLRREPEPSPEVVRELAAVDAVAGRRTPWRPNTTSCGT